MKMITKLICLLVVAVGLQSAHAQTRTDKEPGPMTAAKAFAAAPLSVFPTIDPMTRLDMIDYFNSGSDKASKNQLNGECRITAMTDNSLTFNSSEVAEHTIAILPEKNDTILMVITTLKTPIEDSSVKFYTTDWKSEKKGLFIVPTIDDWTLPEEAARKDDLENAFPFILARISYVPETGILTLSNNAYEFLTQENDSLSGSLHQRLTYKWDGKKMVKVK